MKNPRTLLSSSRPFTTGNNAQRAPGHRSPMLDDEAVKNDYDPNLAQLVEQMLIGIGEDPEREGLQRTPLRVAQSLDFLTSGYQASLAEIVNDALFETDSDEIVIVKDIEFYSLCEHHLLPFFGKIHIGYIPNGQIIGLSKLARVVEVFARRLQVQEHMTTQIADALVEILNPHGVAVISDASHLCMMMRGVQKQNSTTLTSAMRGLFKLDRAAREEFLQMVRM